MSALCLSVPSPKGESSLSPNISPFSQYSSTPVFNTHYCTSSKCSTCSSSSSARTKVVLDAAYSSDSKKRVKASWSCFTIWADVNGYYNHPLRPPPEDCIVDYISQTMAGIFCSQTARKHVRYLQHHSLENGFPWDQTPRIAMALRGVKNLTNPKSVRPLRSPVTLRHLELLHDNLDLKSPADTCIFAAATTAFYGMNRTKEILSSNSDVGRYQHLTLPIVADLALTDDRLAYTLSLPSTKTQMLHKDSVLIPSQAGDKTCPVAALFLHINSNRLQDSSPLFSYVGKDSHFTLTTRHLMSRCNDIWSAFGLDRLTGHSFRIGGTTHYLECGVDSNVIKAAGRWKSDVFQAYWRHIDKIAARGLVNVRNASRVDLLAHLQDSGSMGSV